LQENSFAQVGFDHMTICVRAQLSTHELNIHDQNETLTAQDL
jgi:hypothetical protein